MSTVRVRRVRIVRRPYTLAGPRRAAADTPSPAGAGGRAQGAPLSRPPAPGIPVFVIGSPEFTSQARTAMNSASACHLVGSALDTTGASELSRSQVALIDSRGGGRRNGAEVARALQKLSPGCAPVIVLQKVSAQSARWVYEEQATSWSLITLKAMSDPGQLDMAVNSAARGMPWVQPDIRSAVERHVADRVEEFPRSNRRGSTVESLWSGRVSQLVPGMPDHSELRPVNTNSRAYSPDALD